jgi:hypothetical protein
VLLTAVATGVPGTEGGVVSEPDEPGRVVPVAVPETLDRFPAASNARTVYE